MSCPGAVGLSAWLTWSADHLREWAKQLDSSVTSAEAQQAQARSGAAPIGSSPSGPPEHWRRLVAERAPHLLDPISSTPSVADAPRPVSAVPRIDHADRQGQMLSPQQREHRDVTIPATPPTAPPADMADRPILWQRGPRLSATQAPLKATDVARRPKPMAPDHEPPEQAPRPSGHAGSTSRGDATQARQLAGGGLGQPPVADVRSICSRWSGSLGFTGTAHAPHAPQGAYPPRFAGGAGAGDSRDRASKPAGWVRTQPPLRGDASQRRADDAD